MRELTTTLLEVHQLLREALVQVFEREGVRVLSAHQEPEAFISALKHEHPAVAVVGVLLPDTAGQILRQLRALPSAPPVVVLGTTGNHSKVVEVERLGARAYLDRFKVGCGDVLAAVRLATTVADVAVARPAPASVQEHSASDARGPDPLAHLSDRELEVLGLIGIGMVNRAIGTALGISEHTVKVHVSRLYRKLGHHSRTELALLARDLGVSAPRLFG